MAGWGLPAAFPFNSRFPNLPGTFIDTLLGSVNLKVSAFIADIVITQSQFKAIFNVTYERNFFSILSYGYMGTITQTVDLLDQGSAPPP